MENVTRSIKKKDMLSIWALLEGLGEKKFNAKLSYSIAKNKLAIKNEVDAIKEMADVAAADPKYQEYEKERVSICREFSDKDKDGNPLTVGRSYQISNDRDKFEQKIEELKSEYKEALDEFDAKSKEIESVLEGEVTIEFIKIDLDWLTDDFSSAEMEILTYMMD